MTKTPDSSDTTSIRHRRPRAGTRNRGGADALQTKIAVGVLNLDPQNYKEQLQSNINELPDAAGCDAAFAALISEDGAEIESVVDQGECADRLQRLIEEMRRQGVPFGVRIVEATNGETATDAYDFQAFLGEAKALYRVALILGLSKGREVAAGKSGQNLTGKAPALFLFGLLPPLEYRLEVPLENRAHVMGRVEGLVFYTADIEGHG